MKETQTRKPEAEIASYIGKVLRDKFGKGPESVFVTISLPFISVYIRNFFSPIEQALMDQKEANTIQNTRALLMESLRVEIKAYIQVITGVEIKEFYYDWNIANKTGAFLAIAAQDKNSKNVAQKFKGKDAVDLKIKDISQEVQKAPEHIESYRMNDRLMLVIREGILVKIEKELIRQGYEKILKTTKRILEKSYLHDNEFEKILNQKVTEIFVDWDFDLDKSAIWFILNGETEKH
ncbi:Na-translocating system protein MpsC family protein [Mesobacillus harenae]|uniref:Na-translocating system protein MpsC family protein n=1 Tax=Mesobacillus harenae TaxID=2213203 RepID=UPI00157FE7D1|nr:Na-translocating system protein MpsC family protein [Mesobacillus harenae]